MDDLHINLCMNHQYLCDQFEWRQIKSHVIFYFLFYFFFGGGVANLLHCITDGGGGVLKLSKNYYVIYEWPLKRDSLNFGLICIKI